MNKVYRIANWLHKWTGLLLAIQVLFWIAGGLIMSVIPLDKVHGNHLANRNAPAPLPLASYQYSLDKLISTQVSIASKVELAAIAEKPIYLLHTADGKKVFDATNGAEITTQPDSVIRQLALQRYLGDGQLVALNLVEAPHEASGVRGQVWRADFDDTWHTSLYFAPDSAQLLKVRSDLWRIFDFVWMLHIMDYDEREDFNNPLLISFAAAALLFTITGFILLFRSFKPKLARRLRQARL